MARDKIEIRLTSEGGNRVDLREMSIEALESFITVTSSLKNIAESQTRDITFTIKNGSAYASVNAGITDIDNIILMMDQAIEGESEDELVTENMRSIQSQLKKSGLNYQLYYSGNNQKDKIVNASKITKKRIKIDYHYQLEVIEGFFNSLGGNQPNYHFDYGDGDKKIVDCSREDVQELKDYLYKDISCLVLKKYNDEYKEKTVYTHYSLLLGEQVNLFKWFLDSLNNSSNLFDRLELIYDFVEKSKDKISDLEIVLKSCDYLFSDINELKTLLILTRGFSVNKNIQQHRERLNVILGKELNYF